MNGFAMGSRFRAGLCWSWLWCAATALHAGQDPSQAAQPAVEELGEGRYRVGSILVDKGQRSFRLPGQVLERNQPDGPIEFIAVSRGGMKAYEAVFELETTAVEFNLACILIGLDAEGATLPQYHFDPAPLQGPTVTVSIEWRRGEGRTRIPVEQAIAGYGPGTDGHAWVYTGSYFNPAGQYMAEESGTLVGFVHDMDSIVQHRTGLGLGDYGAIVANTALLPPPGTPVFLLVEARAD